MFKRLRINRKLLNFIQQPRMRQEADTVYLAVSQLQETTPRAIWNKASADTLAKTLLVQLVNGGSLHRGRLTPAGEHTYSHGRLVDEELLRVFDRPGQ